MNISSSEEKISELIGIYGNRRLFDYLRKYYHDVQGLIRNVSNLLQIIKFELKESQRNDLLKHINAAITSLSVLNDWNSILVNYQTLNEDSSCELSNVISRIQVMLSSQIQSRNCTIELDPKIPPLGVNSIDVLRIFKNLIENSIKHALIEDLVISISLKSISNDCIEIAFADNGRTLPEYIRTNMQVILQGKKSDSLGLTIVLESLAKNNGSIELVPSEKGCVYSIILPFCKGSYEI